MHWEAWVTLIVIVTLLLALARNLFPPDITLIAALILLLTLSLFSTKFPDARAVAASFGNEGLLTVGVLFVVAAALTETGAISLLTERLLGYPRSIPRAQIRMMAPVVIISAFLNNTPVVAMFMPVVGDWCKRTRVSPSKLLIPLSYAAILGGTCTLIGTSTNLVVQGMLIDARLPPFKMFTITPIGAISAAIGLTYLVIFSRWLLPDRIPAAVELEDPRQYTVEMLVQDGSPIEGQTIQAAGLRNLPGAYLMEIDRNGDHLVAVGPEQKLHGGDRLIFVGVVESVVDLQKIRGLLPATDQVFKLSEPRPSRRLVEAVVSNTNPLIGKTVKQGRFRTRYQAAIIAAHRNGHRLRGKIGEITLEPGDTLLLETHSRFADEHRNSRDFYLVSAVADSHPRRHDKAYLAIAILLLMVFAMAFEGQPVLGGKITVLNVSLLAAALLIATGCCSIEQARRSIEWPTLLAIGASFAIGRAMETTGLAQATAHHMISLFRGFGASGVLLGVYAVTLLFTHFVTHNASAVLAFPIAKAAALALHANFMPFAICLAMAASNGYATPLGYATHLMVYGPGGYRFTDFIRVGLPLDLLVLLVAVTLAPIFFPFYPA